MLEKALQQNELHIDRSGAIIMQPFELRNLLADAVELGYKKAKQEGNGKLFISKRKLEVMIGAKRLNDWETKGLISPEKLAHKRGESTQYRMMDVDILIKSGY